MTNRFPLLFAQTHARRGVRAAPSQGPRKHRRGDHRPTRLIPGLGIAVALALAAPASAHQGPEILKLGFRPDSDTLVMVSNRGLIFAAEGSRELRLLCMDALEISNTEQPDVALLRDGRVLIATSGGLRATADRGCSFTAVEPYGSTMSPALTQDPGDPDTLYLATFADGASRIQVSHDASASWAPLYDSEPNEFIQELYVGPADSTVLYASGIRIAQGQPRTHFIVRSLDGGQNWTRFPIELLPTETDVVLLALHPSDANVVVVKTIAREPLQRLLLSADGGESWQSVLQTELLHDARFSASGEVLWAASDAGLARSSDRGEHFDWLPPSRWMSSLQEHDGVLWASGQFDDDVYGIGTSRDSGKSFEPIARMQDLIGSVECPAESPTPKRCEGSWDDWQLELASLVPVRSTDGDAGASAPQAGAAAEADAGPSAATRPSDDGCAVATTRMGGGSTALLLLAAALWLQRRRTPR